MKRIAIFTMLLVLGACKKTGSSSGTSGANAINTEVTNGVVSEPIAQAKKMPNVPRDFRSRSDLLFRLGRSGTSDWSAVCTRGRGGRPQQAASVTHYYIPPSVQIGDAYCRNGYAYTNQPEMVGTCLHPCRTLAADPRFYRPGEILYFPALVGLKCGSGANRMVHDGFMVVADNGDPDAINVEGRFGVFWGSCNRDQNGFCLDEGAIALDYVLTFSHYCRSWRPQDPLHNRPYKLTFFNRLRSEASRRGDVNAASSFDLDEWIGLGVDANGIIYRH